MGGAWGGAWKRCIISYGGALTPTARADAHPEVNYGVILFYGTTHRSSG